MPVGISILSADQIDRIAWNNCIRRSSNGLIYAHAEFLDHLAPRWLGIVYDNYTAVMPVPLKKKWGISYTPSIPFVQQLGIFSTTENIPENLFLETLFSVCSYGDYSFNFGNRVANANRSSNFVLQLNNGVEQLSPKFSDDARQIIRKGLDLNLDYQPGTAAEAIAGFKKLYSGRVRHITDDDYIRFSSYCESAHGKDSVVVRKIIDKSGNLNSIILMLRDERRLYNMMNNTTEAGRRNGSNYLLLFQVWKEFGYSELLFDFEGSDLPGVKSFYRKFSPIEQPYSQLHFNRLPKIIRWLKP